MKKTLLATTALGALATFAAAGAMAAEAPTWKLTGNANFQFYWVDQDLVAFDTGTSQWASPSGRITSSYTTAYTVLSLGSHVQDHGWYFGVDEAELQLNVSGTADNGLN